MNPGKSDIFRGMPSVSPAAEAVRPAAAPPPAASVSLGDATFPAFLRAAVFKRHSGEDRFRPSPGLFLKIILPR